MVLKKVYFFCFSLMFWCHSSYGYFPESSYRDLNTDYSVYEKEASSADISNVSGARSALRTASIFNPKKLPQTTPWASKQKLQERFETIRDLRFLKSRRESEFTRRSSWLYPDDGCYARAALANRNLFRSFYPIPGKVFAFGNLSVKTENSPNGKVGWWYHVAPIVEVEGVKFVLDPSVEALTPLTLEEWISKMGDPEKIKVSICSSGTYGPRSKCDMETDGIERRAEKAQQIFLELEWKRLSKLGRHSELELGDHPPWKVD
jgi:hypothetical protein